MSLDLAPQRQQESDKLIDELLRELVLLHRHYGMKGYAIEVDLFDSSSLVSELHRLALPSRGAARQVSKEVDLKVLQSLSISFLEEVVDLGVLKYIVIHASDYRLNHCFSTQSLIQALRSLLNA